MSSWTGVTCESCGYVHDPPYRRWYDDYLHKCYICGDRFCTSCLAYEAPDYSRWHVCKDCDEREQLIAPKRYVTEHGKDRAGFLEHMGTLYDKFIANEDDF